MKAAVLLLLASTALAGPPGHIFPGCKGGTLEGCPGTANCTTHWIEQRIDHFNWAAPLANESHRTYSQRYFVYDKYWKPDGPVFFYLGNEDNVELYVNHTGLMWESAESFGALMVWAEHRYYGESLPYAPGTPGCMSYLTSEQAMADFAYLIDRLRAPVAAGGVGADRSAFIGFGGSYGGMLAAWFRVHYPSAVDGVISASAPIWSFVGLEPPYNYNAFDKGVTYDASAAGGASDACKRNLKAAWPRILAAGATAAGPATLSAAFRTCSPLRAPTSSVNDAWSVMDWASGPWGNMAMGNYPYASSYLMHGKSLLPPWPVRAACRHLDGIGDASAVDDATLFAAVREAAATQHNNTGDQVCFNITGQPPSASRQQQPQRPPHHRKMTTPPSRRPPSAVAAGNGNGNGASCLGDWGYQWCTEMTQPFVSGTADDFFYCAPGACCNQSCWGVGSQGCKDSWGVEPRPEWARVGLGGKRIADASNIVFSNGLLDPWHGGGVLANLSDSLLAIVLPNGAHHIDLMFSDPADAGYWDIGWARDFERTQMAKWVTQHAAARRRGAAQSSEL